MLCAQDHLNRICKLLNEVDCKRQNNMGNVFPCMVGRGRFPGVRGGGKKMGKGRDVYSTTLFDSRLCTLACITGEESLIY